MLERVASKVEEWKIYSKSFETSTAKVRIVDVPESSKKNLPPEECFDKGILLKTNRRLSRQPGKGTNGQHWVMTRFLEPLPTEPGEKFLFEDIRYLADLD